MHEIFISYRRVDTQASASHLYDELARAFGAESVFMDIRGAGIPWGADYEERLQHALANCQVLLALVGPVWVSCQRHDGQRRLLVPDDWVRCEIATALRRGVPVLPVLLQGAGVPGPADLPDELRDLRFDKRNGGEISETRWAYDVQCLVDSLATQPALRALRERQARAQAPQGLDQLRQLILHDPRVAEAVALARNVFEVSDREVAVLARVKAMHDVMHGIEKDVLIPLRTSPLSAEDLQAAHRGYRWRALRVARLLKASSPADFFSIQLHEDLPQRLRACARTLKAALTGGPAEAKAALGQLEGLISYAPSELNRTIEVKAQALQLRLLVEKLGVIREVVGPDGVAHDQFRPLQQHLDTLDRLEQQLQWRVLEHGRLQVLDRTLRRICKGEHPAAGAPLPLDELKDEWVTLKRRLRDLRKPPHTDELQAGLPTFGEIARDIDGAFASADTATVLTRLRGFHNVEVGVFLEVNAALKRFLDALGQETGPLKTVLDMCPVGAST